MFAKTPKGDLRFSAQMGHWTIKLPRDIDVYSHNNALMHSPGSSRLMLQLIWMFEDHVADNSSLVEIKDCLEDQDFGTKRSRNIFDTVRSKTLKAHRLGRDDLLVQRYFEEACAKALFNFGRPDGAYDPDAQFWIVPYAFRLAKHLELPTDRLVDLITKN